jgi:outer membrane protein TolC
VGVARLGVEQADENVRSTDEKYAKGAASSTDVLDASVALLQARTNLTGALVDLELAHTRLLKSLGVRSGNLRGSLGETRHE